MPDCWHREMSLTFKICFSNVENVYIYRYGFMQIRSENLTFVLLALQCLVLAMKVKKDRQQSYLFVSPIICLCIYIVHVSTYLYKRLVVSVCTHRSSHTHFYVCTTKQFSQTALVRIFLKSVLHSITAATLEQPSPHFVRLG